MTSNPARLPRYALAAASAYLAIGVAWILGSDYVIAAISDDADILSRMQSAKGLLFIALSAIAIYFVIRLYDNGDDAAVASVAGERERPRLRLQLLLLAGATTLPLIALLAYNVHREARRDQDAAAESAHHLARLVATDAARVVRDTRMIAEALAGRPGVRALDASGCDAQIAEITTLLPYIANAASVRADGSVVCTALPQPASVNFAGFPTFQGVVKTGRPAIGGLSRGAISGKWIVPVTVGIRDASGAVSGAVVLAIDVLRLAPRDAQAENEGFVALVDPSGRVLMRVPEEGRIGADASKSAIVRIALERQDGHARAHGRKGNDQIFGFAHVDGADWVAIAAVPARTALAASRESAARSSIFGALLLLIAGIAAYAAGRSIERPMRAIARTVRRVAEGDASARAPVSGSHETAEVAAQLNRLLDRLPAIESRLRESERRLDVVIGAAREGILVSDADERIRFANGAAARLLGFADPSEITGRTGGEVLPRGLVDEREHHLAQRREGPGDRYEVRIRAHDGAMRWLHVSATPLRSDSGGYEGLLAMLYDITEGKDVEERLARMTRLYWALSKVNEAIVRTADRATLFAETCRIVVEEGGFKSAFVCLLDREGTRLVPVASAGATTREIGRDPLSLVPGAPYADGVLATAIASGEPQVVNDFEGEPRTLPARELAASLGIRSCAVLPLRCEARTVGALAVYATEVDYFDIGLSELLHQVAEDISFALDVYERAAARDHAERGIRELNADLERRVEERTARLTEVNRELEAFSYSVSHDLRAPVRAINGFARILQSHAGGALDAEGTRLLASIIRASGHLGQQIDDLLAFAQLGSNALDLRAVALAPLIGRIVDQMQPVIDACGGRVEIAADLPDVLGDPTLLHQVFANLLGNAIEYRRPEVRPVVAVFAENAGERVAVAIRDNGIGIAPEDQPRIFETFARLHSASEHPGTGIGLAIVAKATALMHGEVSVESTPGEGSTFRVFLLEPSRVPGATRPY